MSENSNRVRSRMRQLGQSGDDGERGGDDGVQGGDNGERGIGRHRHSRRAVLTGTGAVLGASIPATATTQRSSDISVRITRTNDPVAAGEFLSVTAVIRNEGFRRRTVTVRLIVGWDPDLVDSERVTIGGGGQTEIEVGYSTYPVQQDVEFPVRVEVNDAFDEQQVRVFAGGPSPFRH